MCLASLCASTSITVEQFVEVCSSNSATDAAYGIYTSHHFNVLDHGCQEVLRPVQSTCTCTLASTDTAVSHRQGQTSSVLIKTLKLLAPSSTNPIALCSLILQPNSLTQRLSHSSPSALAHCLSPYVSVSICDFLWWMEEAKAERGECETLHHWGQWGKGEKIERMKEAEPKRGVSRKRGRGVVAHGWHTKAPTCTLPLHLCPACKVCVCLHLCVFMILCAPEHVYTYMCVQGRGRLNLYLWSVPRRD